MKACSLTATDENGDGNANFADFLTFVGKFGSGLGQDRYDPRCDLNGDGDENTLSFFLTISANLMPSLGDASVNALAWKQEIASLTLPQATGSTDSRSARGVDL